MHALVDAFWQGRNKLKKQRRAYFDNYKKPKAACALGAVYYGLYKKTQEEFLGVAIAKEYPEIRYWTKVPCEHDDVGLVSSILIHLNDDHDARSYPDEKIADWLEGALKDATPNRP